ncbi:MAG: LLM class flavin-dependent oxidoreductase [Gammaproteobacteria bacterium]|nr:LLM class flavin-dependent oxidoreductase [Gammaproteobacteria bacterium]MCP5201286.1 LLM class flavin-dependent oxidoreductase [Gammaproteobacteria bacterium]
MQRYSILDLAPVTAGSDCAEAFRRSVDLARHAEQWGYHRYWLAEHHNMPGIASSATAIVIGHVAGATTRIRVGAGGIMLPNHSPLVIAEQFGTLASLYPGRIDLGLGRAPGSDQLTARALRRASTSHADRFPDDVQELIGLFAPATAGQALRAVPGAGLEVPVWILGSSLFGAQLAAWLGLPYAFASHFAPDALLQAVEIYRAQFRPSAQLEQPYVMVGAGLYVADNEREARRLYTSMQIQFTNLFRGAPGEVQPPIEDMDTYWTPAERAGVERALKYCFVGDREQVAAQLADFVAQTGADEVMLAAQIHDHAARLRSYEIGAGICAELCAGRTVPATRVSGVA